MPPLRRRTAAVAAYTLLLYASFTHNVLCVPEAVGECAGTFRSAYLGYDSALVLNRLADGPGGPGGLPALTAWDAAAGVERPYRSQYGLQGEVLSVACRATGADPFRFAVAAAGVGAGLFALGLALVFASLGPRVGWPAAHVGVVLTAAVPVYLPFAPSLYWVPVALLAPFLAAWFLIPWAGRRLGRWAVVGVLVGVLVGMKCLCGYEYVTTVILAPVAALAYHATVRRAGLWRAAVAAAGLWAAGVAGFAGAVAVHAAQIERDTGTPGLGVIRERAVLRAGVTDARAEVKYLFLAPDPECVPEAVRYPVRCFLNYFWLPAVASPQTWGGARFAVSLGAVTLAAAGLGAVALAARRRLPPEVVALVPAGAVGFAGAVSWQALAVNHMTAHVHLNLIVFTVPFLPLAFAGVGVAVQALAARCRVGRPALGWAVGGAVVLAVGVNVVVLNRRAAAEAEADAEAVAAVGGMLRGDRSAGPPAGWLPGPAERLAAPPRGSLLGAELDPRLTPAARGAGGPAVRVVAVRDGAVVAARTDAVRLTTVERTIGGAASWTSVTLVVEGAGSPPRLFAVTGPAAASVTEVTPSAR
ncbi:hypothetical protein J0H58_03780 [bacterium]|nr:hypothetical protein [bacterium]